MVEEPESQTRRDLTRDARVLRGSRFKRKILVATTSTSNGSYAE